MTIYRSNLVIALKMAVDSQLAQEKAEGHWHESAFLASLRETLARVQKGESLLVRESNERLEAEWFSRPPGPGEVGHMEPMAHQNPTVPTLK